MKRRSQRGHPSRPRSSSSAWRCPCPRWKACPCAMWKRCRHRMRSGRRQRRRRRRRRRKSRLRISWKAFPESLMSTTSTRTEWGITSRSAEPSPSPSLRRTVPARRKARITSTSLSPPMRPIPAAAPRRRPQRGRSRSSRLTAWRPPKAPGRRRLPCGRRRHRRRETRTAVAPSGSMVRRPTATAPWCGPAEALPQSAAWPHPRAAGTPRRPPYRQLRQPLQAPPPPRPRNRQPPRHSPRSHPEPKVCCHLRCLYIVW
mmetsp:Transcript_104130/g.264429  ORF Transcript_104130/g.264429 Transcript_104130/m.264429 type:complete len:258 (-) Transcript_104130:115-888(-)